MYCYRGLVTALVFIFNFTSSTALTESLSFILLGDWGWEGSENASAVAYQMGVYSWRVNAQFVLALGDNFYVDGVANTTDRLWDTAFHDVYSASSLNIPWYPILGNHDYHGSVQAQIDRSAVKGEDMWKMPAKYYALTETLPNGETLSIINIDTAILEPDHDDTQVLLEDEAWEQNRDDHLKWIDSTLEEHSKLSTWVIVCGHYPIYSVGVNGDNSVLLKYLYPILKFHNIHMFVAGHDHNSQYIPMPDGITHVIAGNGAGRGPFGPEGYNHLGISKSTKYIKNYFTDSSFAYIEAGSDTLKTTFVDAKGNIHYTGTLSNPHTEEYRDKLEALENNNYHSQFLGRHFAVESSDEFYDFAFIFLAGFAAIAFLSLYVFRDTAPIRSVIEASKSAKDEAVVEIRSLFFSQSVRPEIRVDVDLSTRSNVGLTSDMDRSGRRENIT